jgi:hypothetical protein
MEEKIMLLRRIQDYETRLGLGQLFGTIGLISLIASGALGNPTLFSLFMKPSFALGFLQGFSAGMGGALLGLSLVFNTAALLSIRKERSSGN